MMMKHSIIFFIFLLTLFSTACHNDKPLPSKESEKDTMYSSIDTLQSDSIKSPPKAADGLFDDFIYSFMHNPRFQLTRIDFPLTNIIDGVNKPIQRNNWKHDYLYSQLDTYTIIFDSEQSTKAQKDTSLNKVFVEWVYLNKQRVKRYCFEKKEGQWLLTRIEHSHLKENINSDFYNFYNHFSTDTNFQIEHIKSPFTFKTQDFDNFQTIEGLLDVEQWLDYQPKLPCGTITNINYGQSYGNAKKRLLMICSPSGGMGCSLTFERTKESWMLIKLEN